MKNIAYKTSQGNPNLPNGFITDHFETDEDAIEGYTVVDKNVFSQLLQNNVMLMRSHETSQNIKGAGPGTPPFPRIPNRLAEPTDHSIIEARKKEVEEAKKKSQQETADAELFKQFLAWKKSQSDGS